MIAYLLVLFMSSSPNAGAIVVPGIADDIACERLAAALQGSYRIGKPLYGPTHMCVPYEAAHPGRARPWLEPRN